MKYRDIMQSFTTNNIPNLDVCVLAALELFSKTKIPKLKIPYKHPLVVGSGNAIATGRILFGKKDVVFADESTFKQKLKNIKSIDGVVLISASGKKHAPIIAECSEKFGKHVTLITNNKDAPAKKFLDHKHVYDCYLFPKNREPYTYNTSTYMGPILGMTKEDPRKIIQFIKKSIDRIKMPDFSKYKRYYLVVPEEFEGIIRLLNVKFIELFGRNIARDIETYEYVKHATTVVPAKNELFITFGRRYTEFGEHHLYIPLPKNAGYGAMMAIGYYIIGKIQASHPAWFKKNIVHYTEKVSKIFKQQINPIVE
ncbi:TPA: hypothetical protein HA278_00030 [Candidatus Woesearchaeota archaeon]|nr:hypothetical protein [archaeon]HIJ10416.1 hypothetical protein [Candidatus Woesearchaeota archaeon]